MRLVCVCIFFVLMYIINIIKLDIQYMHMSWRSGKGYLAASAQPPKLNLLL